MRTPYVIIGVLLAIFLVAGFAGEKTEPRRAKPAAPLASVASIAGRVEALRGLRYRAIPKPVRVTAAQATKDGLADLDRGYPPTARAADQVLYETLGLLPAGTDLRKLSASVFGEQVAGYYDPISKRLKIVQGTATANRVLFEVALSHELTHALDDQAIGLDQSAVDASDDRGFAYKALVEGTATQVMYAYLARYFKPDVALGGLLGGSFLSASTGDLPPFVSAGLLFPYQQGQIFIRTLYQRAGGHWTLVDLAERTRRPTSTEQILHPGKWLAAEQPDRVRTPAPPRGYVRRTEGTFGEFQTAQWLALSGRRQPAAAAGWGGDHYALYERTGQKVLVVRWRWDTPRDRAQFGAALRATLTEGLGARAGSHGAYRLRDGAVAVGTRSAATTLAFAPGERLALRLSRATVR